MLNKSNSKEYSYYISTYNGEKKIYRIEIGRIDDNVTTLEVYIDGVWEEKHNAISTFMSRYVTGWINEDDALSFENAIKILNNE